MPATARLRAVDDRPEDDPRLQAEVEQARQAELRAEGAARALAWLQTEADDNILVCRGRGPRHGFDPLVRGRELTSTWSLPITTRRGRVTGYRIVQLCPDCELVWRELIAGPDQVIPEPAKWHYWRDKRYCPPPGSGRIRASAARTEASRRLAEDGTLATLADKPMPAHVAEYVEASDLRAEQAEARKRRRAS